MGETTEAIAESQTVLRVKNTLSQTIPVQLFTKNEAGEKVLTQRNLTRKETFEIEEWQISPAMQCQVDSKILKIRR